MRDKAFVHTEKISTYAAKISENGLIISAIYDMMLYVFKMR
jgi:hypothetical protein